MKPKTKICKLLYFLYILPSIHFRGKLSLFLNIVDYDYFSFTEQYSDFCNRFSSRFSWSVAFIRCRWEIARYWQSEQYFFFLSPCSSVILCIQIPYSLFSFQNKFLPGLIWCFGTNTTTKSKIFPPQQEHLEVGEMNLI